ncbi:MAG: 3-dehydroquinate synthase, partial [Deltaproteobacteria bacterium]|nr:3-dehydroquinate synthase [Deltaproteobacteria bacterium]
MKEIVINLGSRSYPVFIGKDLFSPLPRKAKKILAAASRVVLVTHPQLARLYGRKLKFGGQKVETLLVSSGERTKSLETVQKIYKALLKMK